MEWRHLMMSLVLATGCGDKTDTGPVAVDTGSELDADDDGYASGMDCDDADPDINPGADEYCDGVDNDCDDVVDEGAVDASTWYADADGDGYGTDKYQEQACEQPSMYVAADPDAVDCDDADATQYPGAEETCNGEDNDCDEEIDEDTTDAGTFYADADGDGYGDETETVQACEAPSGYVEVGEDDEFDCDDDDASAWPGADELCDDIDNDCDGEVDESSASDAGTWYLDSDGDGYGDATVSTVSCDAPTGYVAEAADGYDCDDHDDSVYPGADEYCDGVDHDCDDEVNEDSSVDASTWYLDTDGDGYGQSSSTTSACDQPSGYVATGGDCDDTGSSAASTWPGAAEEESSTDCMLDADGDGYGSDAPAVGGVVAGTDCDDTDPDISPAADEVCDDTDNDCDGDVDDDDPDLVDATTWYYDEDGDGYGDPAITVESCEQPTVYVADGEDCDDDDADIYPGTGEVWYDGFYSDCDTTSDYDADLDGYDSSAYGGTDCDDTDSTISPDASESTCDGIDEDCDGDVDEGSVCPCEVDTYDGRGYMFCTDELDWASAQEECWDYGYHLVEIADSSENSWLWAVADSISSTDWRDWWIGYSDSIDEGEWVDENGREMAYANWNEDEPNDDGGEDCAEIYDHGTEGAWNDVACEDSQPYICESYSYQGDLREVPGDSCADILDNRSDAEDGSYWLELDGALYEIACDMWTDGGGWTRLVDHDYSADSCPSGWDAETSQGVCYRADASGGQSSATFDAYGISWSGILVSMSAYQWGSTDAFKGRSDYSKEENYVDGVSLTAGSSGSREHVFTYAVGQSTDPSASASDGNCPSAGGDDPQSFVGDDYTCESGNTDTSWDARWYSTLLFEDEWFQAELEDETTSDVEARIITNQGDTDENIGVATLELYIR